MTAMEALQHPWLRDAVTPPPRVFPRSHEASEDARPVLPPLSSVVGNLPPQQVHMQPQHPMTVEDNLYDLLHDLLQNEMSVRQEQYAASNHAHKRNHSNSSQSSSGSGMSSGLASGSASREHLGSSQHSRQGSNQPGPYQQQQQPGMFQAPYYG